MVERDDLKTVTKTFGIKLTPMFEGRQAQVDYKGWADSYDRQLRICAIKGSRRWDIARPWRGITGGRGWNMAYDWVGHVEVPEGKVKLTWAEFGRQLRACQGFMNEVRDAHDPDGRYFRLVASALWWAFKMVEKEA